MDTCNLTTYYWCPGGLDFCSDPDQVRFNLGRMPTYLSLLTSVLSVLGSLLIAFSYWRWKDLRTGSRSIILYLAIADFFTAAGLIMAAGNYLYYYGQPVDTPECVKFQRICVMQAFITSWSSVASFVWTSILAIYLYLSIVRRRTDLAAWLLPLGHVIAWVLSYVIIFPLLCAEKLGLSLVATSNWCFVKGPGGRGQPLTLRGEDVATTILLVMVAGEFWLIGSYVTILIFYALIKWHIRKETKGGNSLSQGVRQVTIQVDRKLTFVPMVFVLLRMWGTIQFFYTLSVSEQIECGCVSKHVYVGFFALGLLQAIGDGGQGWGNAILWIFATKVLRERLFGWICRPVCGRCLHKDDSPSTSGADLLGTNRRTLRGRLVAMVVPSAWTQQRSDTSSRQLDLPTELQDSGSFHFDIEPTTVFSSATCSTRPVDHESTTVSHRKAPPP